MPPMGWFKANIDGASNGNPGMAACGGIFRMYRGFSMGCFALPLGVKTSVFAEIMGFIKAVELANDKD